MEQPDSHAPLGDDVPGVPYRPYSSPRGPRFSGRAIFGGFGLLGLLLTVAIMGVLGAKVLSTMSDSTSDPAGVTETLPPGDDTPGVSPLDPDPGGLDGARDAACAADLATLKTAAGTYELLNGAAPTEQQDLVDAGLLSETVASQELSVVDGTTMVEGIGACAGG